VTAFEITLKTKLKKRTTSFSGFLIFPGREDEGVWERGWTLDIFPESNKAILA